MDLDADPVELPLDRGAARNPLPHRPTLSAVEASIGRTGRKISKPTFAQPLLSPFVIAIAAVRREIAREHQRAPHDLAGNALPPSDDRVRHQPGQRALPQLAGEESPDEVGFSLGRTAEEIAEDLPAPPAEPLPIARWIAVIARSTSSTVSDASAAAALSTP